MIAAITGLLRATYIRSHLQLRQINEAATASPSGQGFEMCCIMALIMLMERRSNVTGESLQKCQGSALDRQPQERYMHICSSFFIWVTKRGQIIEFIPLCARPLFLPHVSLELDEITWIRCLSSFLELSCEMYLTGSWEKHFYIFIRWGNWKNGPYTF